jgi:hypothetical protein
VLLPRRLLALAAGALTTWFVACAQDAGLDDTGHGGGGGTDGGGDGQAGTGGKEGGIAGSDSGWPTGGFGSPCNKDADCTKGSCVDIGQAKPYKACVIPCDAGCPPNGYCGFHPDKGYLCLPDVGNQCAPCTVDAECPNVGDHCTPSPNVDRFCARDCSNDGKCPTGFECVAPSSYPPGLPQPDGGTPDAGSGEAGAAKPAKMCVPTGGQSCPCDDKRDGVKRKCKKTSGTLTCEGLETCNGSKKAWEGCTAGSPQPEKCDGADNDCDGTADNGTPDTLCAGQGTPPHAKWACVAGACQIGSCDPGWAAYPPGAPSAGCACAVDAAEPTNDSCSASLPSAGSVTDANTTALKLSGTLSSDSDEDWFKFDTIDSDESTTNSYHIKIAFTAPASNTEFVFDVLRGACGAPNATHSNLTDYDWCVDGTGTVAGKTVGEKACGPTAPIHCGPHSKPYYVRVKRKPGAPGTCALYTLTVTAKGGAPCDFTKACDPQIDEN